MISAACTASVNFPLLLEVIYMSIYDINGGLCLAYYTAILVRDRALSDLHTFLLFKFSSLPADAAELIEGYFIGRSDPTG